MATWTSDELRTIGVAEELEIASVRRDGTLRNPVTIWAVRQGDETLRAIRQRTYVLENDAVNDEVDAEYRTKYRHYAPSIIDHITSPEARAATLTLVPRR